MLVHHATLSASAASSFDINNTCKSILWHQYASLITQLQNSGTCCKMHQFTIRWSTFIRFLAERFCDCWHQYHSVTFRSRRGFLGSVKQGNTCWSGTTWTTFSKMCLEPWCGELTQPHSVLTLSTWEKSQIYHLVLLQSTFTCLQEHFWKADSLHRYK